MSIDVASRGERGIPALNATVGNTSRPAYINFLSIEMDRSERFHSADQSTIEMFLRAAPSMSGLKDLRIRLREELSANISGMNDVLWFVDCSWTLHRKQMEPRKTAQVTFS